MTIPLPAVLPRRSSCQPGHSWAEVPLRRSPTALRLNVGPFRARPLFGIAPGGACRAVPVARSAVGSYPTVSPLPHPQQAAIGAVCSLWRFPWGYPRRALPGTDASWSPDFPRPPSYPPRRSYGQPRSSGHPRALPLRRAPRSGQAKGPKAPHPCPFILQKISRGRVSAGAEPPQALRQGPPSAPKRVARSAIIAMSVASSAP